MKENKLIIGIDINEILRSRSLQFDRYYYEEFGSDGLPDEKDPYKFDLRNDYKWEDSNENIQYLNEDLPDDISPEFYQVDEKTGKAKVDSLAFKNETKFVSADEKFKRFMYEDYVFEIHGTAPPIYRGLDKDVEKFYLKYKDQFDIKIISKENWFTIPPTLFFLSKLMLRIKNYVFVENNDELWDNIDILITTDPELLTPPTGKKSVKINRPYNTKIESEVVETQLFNLIDNEEFQNYIGYKSIENNNKED